MTGEAVYLYMRDGSVLGRLTGWDGDVPIIDTTDRLPGPAVIDLATGLGIAVRSRDADGRPEASGHHLPPDPRDPTRHSAGSVLDPAAGRYPVAGVGTPTPSDARRA